jgi:hypothetical protein
MHPAVLAYTYKYVIMQAYSVQHTYGLLNSIGTVMNSPDKYRQVQLAAVQQGNIHLPPPPPSRS